jgi:hypothetical protein
MGNAKALDDVFNDSSVFPAMSMLGPRLYGVGSMPEGTRGGDTQEIDVMMDLRGFKQTFLLKATSATVLSLSPVGQTFFGEFYFAYVRIIIVISIIVILFREIGCQGR